MLDATALFLSPVVTVVVHGSQFESHLRVIWRRLSILLMLWTYGWALFLFACLLVFETESHSVVLGSPGIHSVGWAGV